MSNLTDIVLSFDEVERIDEYRKRRRTAILAMVLSDIVGYTSICERASDEQVLELLGEFEQLTASCYDVDGGGIIIKRIGDAALAVFAEPVTAVDGAVKLHKRVMALQLAVGRVQVRTGIHLGQVTVERTGIHVDVFGRHVNRVARIQAAASPGEILVTEAVEDNVRAFYAGAKSSAVRFLGRTTLTLKGLEDPVVVFRAVPTENAGELGTSHSLEHFITLEVVGSEQVMTFDASFDRRVIIGSAPHCHVRIHDEKCSRTHAILRFEHHGAWTLEDCRTVNGVFVNGGAITQKIVASGDQIRIGTTVIRVTDLA